MNGNVKLGKWACIITGVVATLLASLAAADPWVTVGNPGNDPDIRYEPPGYGSVAYEYRISKYEVTAGEYRDFLNAVNPTGTDPYGLYNSRMDTTTDGSGCQITWNTSTLSYDFSGRPSGEEADWVNRPVNDVSWYDAIRFANWKTSGNTESGTYTITDGGPNSGTVTIPDHATLVPGQWFLPTEDEWYKAAYYDPNKPGGAGYWDYPTKSDTAPSNDLINPDPGNNATFYDGGSTIGSPYYRTEVGAHENSESPYGTFDQGGNVWEWNETGSGSSRVLRGGSWCYTGADYLTASYRNDYDPWFEDVDLGFRLASPIPEPISATFMGSAFVGIAVAAMRRRRKRRT